MDKPQERWVKVLVLVLSSAIALGLAEGFLRTIGIGFPRFYCPDAITGSALRPGAEGWFRREGDSYVRISSQGLRDHEHPIPKPSRTFRVAVLGDSFAEAMQVPMEDAFWAVMERRLTDCPALSGRRIEAVNFGVSGYGTGQEYLMLQHRVPAFQPDLVVLAFLTGNDLQNNVRALERDEMRPYFVLRDGRLVLDDAFLRSSGFVHSQTRLWAIREWVYNQSRLAQVVLEARRRYKLQEQRVEQANLDLPVYQEPSDPLWKEAWAVSEALVAATAEEAKRQGAGFMMVTLTNDEQVHPDPAVGGELAARLKVADLLYPDRRLAAFAGRHGIPVLTLVDPFRAYARDHGLCLHGFRNAEKCGGHWNREGHRLAGELIAKRLCETLAAEAGQR